MTCLLGFCDRMLVGKWRSFFLSHAKAQRRKGEGGRSLDKILAMGSSWL
ncbi:hypothetical protein JYQ62_31615 [Nostoc sp. UHCC 0702]|nr:hypothetical protein JYQ62_31615 [Nostoc sp. UHCC 0702]